MSFWDSILGRKKPVQAKLDALFGLPGAAITLQVGPKGEAQEVGRADFHGRWVKWEGWR